MLPGFRLLFAAIVLSMSMLVFGLGAAALLRVAHEEFASTPLWPAAPETTFAQQGEATTPALAMLRVDTPAAEAKPSDNVTAAARAEPAEVSTPPAPENVAAARPEDPSPPNSVKAEIPIPEGPADSSAAPALAAPPASADETRIVATGDLPAPANETASAAAPEQADAPAAPDDNVASTRIATLGGPPVTIEAQSPATAGAEPEKSADRKRQHARRAARHRRIALRGRTAQQVSQQRADPFAPARR
jgi:hypothetical protein